MASGKFMTVRHIMCFDMRNHMTRHIEMLQDAIECRLKDVSPNGNVVLDIIVNYKCMKESITDKAIF